MRSYGSLLRHSMQYSLRLYINDLLCIQILYIYHPCEVDCECIVPPHGAGTIFLLFPMQYPLYKFWFLLCATKVQTVFVTYGFGHSGGTELK